MKILILALSIFSVSAQAHVATGTFTGKDQNGKECKFTVGKEWFENNQPHPLNERVPVSDISFDSLAVVKALWNAGHPPVVNAEQGKVRFNHDIFQEIMATKTGAATLILLKNPEEEPQGHKPLGIQYIDDNYRDASKSVNISCML